MNSASRKVPISQYSDPKSSPEVFCIVAKPSFDPIDINVEFLLRNGWFQSGDRLRFHSASKREIDPDHPMATLVNAMQPHLLIRRYDREEDCLTAVHIELSGAIRIWSNDEAFARKFLAGTFMECPPSFHSSEEFDIQQGWERRSGSTCDVRGHESPRRLSAGNRSTTFHPRFVIPSKRQSRRSRSPTTARVS